MSPSVHEHTSAIHWCSRCLRLVVSHDGLFCFYQPLLNLLRVCVISKRSHALLHLVHQLTLRNQSEDVLIFYALGGVLGHVDGNHVQVQIVHWLEELCWE